MAVGRVNVGGSTDVRDFVLNGVKVLNNTQYYVELGDTLEGYMGYTGSYILEKGTGKLMLTLDKICWPTNNNTLITSSDNITFKELTYTGELVATFNIAGEEIFRHIIIDDFMIYYISSTNNKVVNFRTGEILVDGTFNLLQSTIFTDENYIYVDNKAGNVVLKFDRGTMERVDIFYYENIFGNYGGHKYIANNRLYNVSLVNDIDLTINYCDIGQTNLQVFATYKLPYKTKLWSTLQVPILAEISKEQFILFISNATILDYFLTISKTSAKVYMLGMSRDYATYTNSYLDPIQTIGSVWYRFNNTGTNSSDNYTYFKLKNKKNYGVKNYGYIEHY